VVGTSFCWGRNGIEMRILSGNGCAGREYLQDWISVALRLHIFLLNV
jgi:hypothetical protein